MKRIFILLLVITSPIYTYFIFFKHTTPSVFKPNSSHVCIDEDNNKISLSFGSTMEMAFFDKKPYVFRYGLSVHPDINGYVYDTYDLKSPLYLYIDTTTNKLRRSKLYMNCFKSSSF